MVAMAHSLPIAGNVNTLYIIGAGMSSGSSIPTFRGEEDGSGQ